jgi:hypothetical protein
MSPHTAGGIPLHAPTENCSYWADRPQTSRLHFRTIRGLSERELLAPTAHKKFEAETHQSDLAVGQLYGLYVQRPGGGKMQTLLHAILDDASRLIPQPSSMLARAWMAASTACAKLSPHAEFRCGSTQDLSQPQLARISASIGMFIVHTPPYQPEGRGKIERFFREQFLNNTDYDTHDYSDPGFRVHEGMYSKVAVLIGREKFGFGCTLSTIIEFLPTIRAANLFASSNSGGPIRRLNLETA